VEFALSAVPQSPIAPPRDSGTIAMKGIEVVIVFKLLTTSSWLAPPEGCAIDITGNKSVKLRKRFLIINFQSKRDKNTPKITFYCALL
jgi:hypothetical protein